MLARINRALGGIVDHPWLVTGLVILITAISALGYYDPELPRRLWDQWRQKGSSVEEFVPNDSGSRAQVQLPNVAAENVYGADTILIVQSDQLFTVDGVQAMRAIVSRLEELPQVAGVRWLDRVPILNIFGLPEPILPRGEPTETQVAASRRKALEHPMVVGQLLSPDAKTLLLMIQIDWFHVSEDADVTTRLAEAAREVVAEQANFDARITFSGSVPLYLAAVESRDENQLRYQVVGYAVIAIAALILFRGPAAVFVVSLAPVLGVFWTLGCLRFLDLADNPFNDVILPTLLSLVGLTDGVHVMVQIRHYRSVGLEPRDAARKGTSDVGLACVLTSVTTAIGFGSLGTADHEVVREFGWCCVIGVGLTLVAILTVIPLACSTILGRRIHRGHETGYIQRNLGKIEFIIDWVVRRKAFVSALAIGSTLALTLYSLQLEPDERRQRGLPVSSEAAQGIGLIDREMGGLELAEVAVQWNEDVASNSIEILEVLDEVHAVLGDEPLIGHPLSLSRLIEGLPGQGPEGNRMAMAELLPPPLKRAFYVPELNYTKVTFRVQDLGIAKYAAVFERVQERFKEIQQRHPSFELELTGGAVFRWENLYRIVVDLATSLGTASVIIFVVLSLVYRSLRIGLISIIPNVFPLALTAAGLVFFDQGLEMVSVCAFTVCLGIAVDDTIHFLTRYLECRSSGLPTEKAIHEAFVGVGTALITTTIVLVAGFMTVLFSDSREHLIFAWMGIATFLSALFADLFFLPALLAKFAPTLKLDD